MYIGHPWGTFMKASIPPTKWATIISSLSTYSNECLHLQRTYRDYLGPRSANTYHSILLLDKKLSSIQNSKEVNMIDLGINIDST